MTLRSPLWRRYVSSVPAIVLGLLTGVVLIAAIRNISIFDVMRSTASIVGMASGLIGSLLGIWRSGDHLSITLTDEHVSGPNGARWRWGRVDLPLRKLDRERTCRQTVPQRLFGYRYLWSIDGQKIRIGSREYAPAQVAALLEELGCNAAER